MPRTVAIVGAGQIGFACAQAFASEGWETRVLARSRPAWSVEGARFERYVAGEETAPEADVVLDTIAFDEDDVARYDPDGIGRLIVVSSASVYCDAEGRTLDEAAQCGFPDFPEPITEDQRTVAPGPQTYSTRKIRMETAARALFGERATILRPCAVYGAHSRHPREWWFVKRLLDGRRRLPLAFSGESQFHTTSAQMMAYFTLSAAEASLGGVFNIADDYAPPVSEIGRLIAADLDTPCEFVRLPGRSASMVGRTPWSVPLPFLLSCRKAFDTGWDGFTTYPGIGNHLDWLAQYAPLDWRAAFPQLAAYPWDLFDYATEDRYLATAVAASTRQP